MDLTPQQLDALIEGFDQLNASPDQPTHHESMRKKRKE